MGEVVELNCETVLPVPTDRVLEAAIGKLDYVLVLGWHKDGSIYLASSESDMTRAVFMATRFIHKAHDGSLG